MAVVTSVVLLFVTGGGFLYGSGSLLLSNGTLKISVGELLRFSSDFGELLRFFNESLRLYYKF